MYRLRTHLAVFLSLMMFGGVPLVSAATDSTGLPLPRYVTLRAPEANMRTGPGEQYPIKWTYRRPGLPLEVIKEYHHWRLVRDWQGSEGWMHSGMLVGKRSIIVTGDVRTLRAKPSADGATIARIEGKVVGKLLFCPRASEWCQVEIGDVRGWLRRNDMWGVYEDEEVD